MVSTNPLLKNKINKQLQMQLSFTNFQLSHFFYSLNLQQALSLIVFRPYKWQSFEIGGSCSNIIFEINTILTIKMTELNFYLYFLFKIFEDLCMYASFTCVLVLCLRTGTNNIFIYY